MAGASAKMPRAARIVLWLLLGWSVVVLQQWLFILKLDLGSGSRNFNIFFYLFAHYELIAWLALVLAVVLSVAATQTTSVRSWRVPTPMRPWTTALMMLGLLGMLWCGTLFIHHSYPFSMDEWNSLFQAKIFCQGQLKSVVPANWRPYARAITPIFVLYEPSVATWISAYLPVYAALRALCLKLGLTELLNPLFAMSSVLLIADCAKRLWPDRPDLPLVAATLLLTSTQFLATSISYYSMPAHLCASLLWLSLYLRDTPRSLALLPWLGGLAIGLHQPVVHPLFVAPFCVEIVRRRRFRLALYCAVVYCAFLGLWQVWHGLMDAGASARELSMFRWPDAEGVFVQTLNVTEQFSWQSAALVLCLGCALAKLRQLSPTLICLALGVVLSFLLYCFFRLNQGHGWGYRYTYAVLGNVVLLATYGWSRLAEQIERARALRMLAVSSCFALLVQMPLRALEVESEIRPFARARDYLATLPADVLVLDHRLIWYGQDLIRNDPLFRQRPVIMDAQALSRDDLPKLKLLGETRLITPFELASLPMIADPQLEQLARDGERATH